MRRRTLSPLVLAGFAFLGGAAAAEAVHAVPADPDLTYKKLAIFARVLSYVENNYVSPVSSEQLIYGAIRGMLATLDTHSTFMDPEQFAAVKSEAQGEFGGIGIELVQRDGRTLVVSRNEDGPAARVGLAPGDELLEVEGASVRGWSVAEVVRRIKGPAGSRLTLSVQHAHGRREVLQLVRDRIQIASVDARRIDRFGYLKIRTFSEHTARDLQRALDLFKSEGPLPGVILDLRDNPGGLLDQAVRVADVWLTSGIIVSTEGRHRPPDVELAHPKATEADYPLVVLVNGGSASASEIVAGALQDHARAVILGTQSFGKGSVQTLIELEDQSALKLTIARYFTPKHRSIQGTGITPDLIVPASPPPDLGGRRTAGSFAQPPGTPVSRGQEDGDPQLLAALAQLRRGAELRARPARSVP